MTDKGTPEGYAACRRSRAAAARQRRARFGKPYVWQCEAISCREASRDLPDATLPHVHPGCLPEVNDGA